MEDRIKKILASYCNYGCDSDGTEMGKLSILIEEEKKKAIVEFEDWRLDNDNNGIEPFNDLFKKRFGDDVKIYLQQEEDK